jgi:hypothetical protein
MNKNLNLLVYLVLVLILVNSASALTKDVFDTDPRYEACADENITYDDLKFTLARPAGYAMMSIYTYEIDNNGISARNGQSYCEVLRDGFNKELEVTYESTPEQANVNAENAEKLNAIKRSFEASTSVERNTSALKGFGKIFIFMIIFAGLLYRSTNK